MSNSEGWGCVTAILWITLLWALIFGVTINGHHYGFSCTGDNGVRIDMGVQ